MTPRRLAEDDAASLVEVLRQAAPKFAHSLPNVALLIEDAADAIAAEVDTGKRRPDRMTTIVERFAAGMLGVSESGDDELVIMPRMDTEREKVR